MNPVFSVVCSALVRAAELVDAGHEPAEALRRCAADLERFAGEADPRRAIPESVFQFGSDVGLRTAPPALKRGGGAVI